MKLGVFAMIPQLNAKLLNRSHQHHRKAKKFVFKSQKWRQCLCVSTTARKLFTASLPWGTGTNYHWKFLFECSGTPMEEDSPCPAPSSWFLVHDNAPGSCCARIFSPKTSVCAPSSALLWLFSVPQTEVNHWRVARFKMFKTSKQLWHRVFGPYHMGRAEVLPVFAKSCHSLYRCRRDALGIKYR